MIDIGVNLTHRSFNSDRDEVIERARAAGVEAMILTGTSIRGSQESAKLARTSPGYLYSTAGVHPHDAGRTPDDTIDVLRGLAAGNEVVAIGECGLDFNRDFSPRDVQERWFAAQLALAVEVELPVFLHARDAHERFIAILADYLPNLRGAVIHCFTGTGAELDDCLERGLHVGITGWICDERRGLGLREIVGRIPADRLMIETDAPFLTPRDLRPKPKKGRNEPSFLPHICQAIAGFAGRSPEAIQTSSTQTAREFFGV